MGCWLLVPCLRSLLLLIAPVVCVQLLHVLVQRRLVPPVEVVDVAALVVGAAGIRLVWAVVHCLLFSLLPGRHDALQSAETDGGSADIEKIGIYECCEKIAA